MSDSVDFATLASALAGIEGLAVELDAPAGSLSTYRVGGPIALLARVDNADALAALTTVVAEAGAVPDFLPIGKGSNLLIADSGFAGIGIVLGTDFASIAVSKADARVTAGAAAPLPLVARATVREGLTGFAWAVGVPGTIGGGVFMNAGGHGSDMAANLVSVEVVDLRSGARATMAADELDLGYRTSNLQAHHVVTSATLQLEPGDATAGAEELSEIVRWRRANQPGGQNAGSVFTNPMDDSAGRMIDVAGMKGRRVGTAEVSTVHANFIQVDPNGSADDVMALMREIVATVAATFGVPLHAETRLVGFPTVDVEAVQPTKMAPQDRAPQQE